MWCTTPTISVKQLDGYTLTKQIPTFYLDEDVQGIASEKHAAKIVEDIVNPLAYKHITVHANVFWLGD